MMLHFIRAQALFLCCFFCVLLSRAGVILDWAGLELRGHSELFASTVIPSGVDLLLVRSTHRLVRTQLGYQVSPLVLFYDSAGLVVKSSKYDELLPREDDASLLDGELYAAVPSGAVKAALRFDYYGNPALIEVVSVEIKPVSSRPISESMRYQPFSNEKLSDAELDIVLASASASQAKIVRRGQYNAVEIDGEDACSIFYTTSYSNLSNRRYNMAKRYNDAGFKMISVSAYLGLGRPCKGVTDIWQGPGKYNIAPLLDEIRELLRQAPDSKILLALNVTQYAGFADAHPDELFRAADGKYGLFFHGYMRKTSETIVEERTDAGFTTPVSYCSEMYNAQAAKAIEDICSILAERPEGKPIVAVYLNGGVDGQWFDLFNSSVPLIADYSPAALKAFRKYLKMKYAHQEKRLQAAWGDDKATFDLVQVPEKKDLWREDLAFHTLHKLASRESDYMEFIGWNRAQQQRLWCGAVKRASGGRWLAGSYYSNSGLRGYPQIGLQSVRYLLDAPEVDLFVIIPNYLRNCLEPVHQGGFSGSLLRNGKILITELDLRNGELPYWGRWGTDFWRRHNSGERFQTTTQRFAVSALEKGGIFHAYDMEGGCFNSEKSIEAWRKANSLFKERAELPLDEKHIGFVASEKMWNYQSWGSSRITVYTARETPLYALYSCGVQNYNYLLEDVFAEDFIAPKVMIFAEVGTMTLEQAREIRKRYANSGRVLVWCWAPGMFTEDGDKNISEITGFKLTPAPAANGLPLFVDDKYSDKLIQGVRNFLFPYVPPYHHSWGFAYAVEDDKATLLANYHKTSYPGAALKRYESHTEVYLGAPGAITAQLLRNFARESGLTPFSETDDFCGLGAGLLYLSATSTGMKTISLPAGSKDIKCLTGQEVTVRNGKCYIEMKIGDLLVLRLL